MLMISTMIAAAAHFLRHLPVHGLHLIDKRRFRDRENVLTIKMKGVKTYSFFDTF